MTNGTETIGASTVAQLEEILKRPHCSLNGRKRLLTKLLGRVLRMNYKSRYAHISLEHKKRLKQVIQEHRKHVLNQKELREELISLLGQVQLFAKQQQQQRFCMPREFDGPYDS